MVIERPTVQSVSTAIFRFAQAAFRPRGRMGRPVDFLSHIFLLKEEEYPGPGESSRCGFKIAYRPDIYITVAKRIGSKWIRIKKSRVYRNHKTKYNLRIILRVNGPSIINGKLLWLADKKPVVGARVYANDSDFGNKDDLLGTSVTNARGEFRIEYARKHWDKAPHRSGKWRPDIYIIIFVQKNGIWSPAVWERSNMIRSAIHWDHKLKYPLQVNGNLKPPKEPPVPSVKTCNLTPPTSPKSSALSA